MTDCWDVIVVGAGPAGLFCALETSKLGLRTLLLEAGKDASDRDCPMWRGHDCPPCPRCDIMEGLGGAGTFSDGTLNFSTDVGGNLEQLTGSEGTTRDLIREVEKILLKAGVPPITSEPDPRAVEEMKRKAVAVGARFLPVRQMHIGSDHTVEVVERLVGVIGDQGVEIRTGSHVDDIMVKNGRCVGVRMGARLLRAGYVVLCPGRSGASWFEDVVKAHDLDFTFSNVDVGVRVEVPTEIFREILAINRDPKFHMWSSTYNDFVRTFCTNIDGWVVRESYKEFIGVNGHSMKAQVSGNTNFALLVRVMLTEPVEDTISYGESIAKLATTIGGGRPIVQRYCDLNSGRRSRQGNIDSNPLSPTLGDATPGDISMALPYRIVQDIKEGLTTLDRILPGVAADSTLLYAPEIKYYSLKPKVNSRLETSVEGLHVAGDGAGLSRGIVHAAATGILAGRGVGGSSTG